MTAVVHSSAIASELDEFNTQEANLDLTEDGLFSWLDSALAGSDGEPVDSALLSEDLDLEGRVRGGDVLRQHGTEDLGAFPGPPQRLPSGNLTGSGGFLPSPDWQTFPQQQSPPLDSGGPTWQPSPVALQPVKAPAVSAAYSIPFRMPMTSPLHPASPPRGGHWQEAFHEAGSQHREIFYGNGPSGLQPAAGCWVPPSRPHPIDVPWDGQAEHTQEVVNGGSFSSLPLGGDEGSLHSISSAPANSVYLQASAQGGQRSQWYTGSALVGPPELGRRSSSSVAPDGALPSGPRSGSGGVCKSQKTRTQRRGVARVQELESCLASLTAHCAQLEAKLQLQSGAMSPPSSFSIMMEATVEEAEAAATPRDMEGLTCEALGRKYKDLVSQVAVQMVSASDSNSDSDFSGSAAAQLAGEVLLLVMRCCMDAPLAAKQWMLEGYRAEQAQAVVGAEAGRMWRATAASLKLAGEQKERIVQLRRLFLGRLEGLQGARGTILASLTAAVPSHVQHRQSTVAQLEASTSIESYCANVKQCDRLICDFVSTFYTQILTAQQMARCLVAGYPWWPDTLAIATCVAAEAGDLGAADALNRHFNKLSLGVK